MFSFLLISEGTVWCQHISCVHGLFCYVSFRQIDILSTFIDVNKITFIMKYLLRFFLTNDHFFRKCRYQSRKVSGHVFCVLGLLSLTPSTIIYWIWELFQQCGFFLIFIVCFHGEVYSIQHYLKK